MTDSYVWPYVEAKYQLKLPPQPRRRVRLLVIHDAEIAETHTSAEDVARYFRNPDKPSSAHVCIDDNSVVQCVWDNNVAYAAPGANRDGIHLELAGYGRQSREEWLDEYGVGLLHNAAGVAAYYCKKYDLPILHLTNDQLRSGAKGIVGHSQVSEVYRESDHTDPGPGFPWAEFLGLVTIQRAAA